MSKKKNSDLKSESFDKKKEIYKNSDIKITKEIEEKYPEWGKESINKRQEFLAEIAVKTWNLNLS